MYKQFRYNREAHPAVQWGDIKEVQAQLGALRVIVTADGDGFSVDLPWISKYAPITQISSEKVLATWHRAPLAWWQTQVNFAVWCATAGCGVGMDHPPTRKHPGGRRVQVSRLLPGKEDPC